MFRHRVLWEEAMASRENFLVFLSYESLNCFRVKWCLFEVWLGVVGWRFAVCGLRFAVSGLRIALNYSGS